jgi:hypothetical protein
VFTGRVRVCGLNRYRCIGWKGFGIAPDDGLPCVDVGRFGVIAPDALPAGQPGRLRLRRVRVETVDPAG